MRGQGRCHPSTLSPSSPSHKMELWSHISLPTHRGAGIQPRPTALGRVRPFSALGPSSGTCWPGFSAQGRDRGHLPLPSSTSATPSPVPASSHQRPPGENLSDSLLAPRPPPPGSSQRCRNRTLSAQFYELQIHTGRATAASLAGPGPPRAVERGSSPHGPPEVTPRSSPPPHLVWGL